MVKYYNRIFDQITGYLQKQTDNENNYVVIDVIRMSSFFLFRTRYRINRVPF